jgi:phage-related protein (TIGR01555 family)
MMDSVFAPARPPPGVVPKKAQIALDSAQNQVIQWAGQFGFYNGTFAQGYTFMGYPYLAELAQVPEYRVITETLAEEMTRKWIRFQAVGDDDLDEQRADRIHELEDRMDELVVRDVFRRTDELDGFFGRGHIYIDLGNTEEREELRTSIGNGRDAVSRRKIGRRNKIYALRPVEPVWTYPTTYNSDDPLRPDWYAPTHWFVMGKEVHVSRLLPFVSRPVPDLLKPAYSFGGLSMSQMAKPYVDNWLQTRQSVNEGVHTYSTMVLGTNLAESMQQGGEQLFMRAELFNATRDNRGLMMTDKESETLENVAVPLGSLDLLQAQAQEHMCAVSKTPTVKLLGLQPAGLNASSEDMMRVFEDMIAARQERFYRPHLTKIVHLVMLELWGEVDESITFQFVPLRSLDERGQAEVQKIKAETDVVLVDGNILHTEESRQRIADDPNSPYPGLDADDVPIEPEDEISGGEEGGGLTKTKINVAGGDEAALAANGGVPLGARRRRQNAAPTH